MFLLISGAALGQGTQLRGIYIDNFSLILGNSDKEDSLLQYAQDSSFNYLALYDLHLFNLSNAVTADKMGAFIKRARDNYGVTYVGAIGESYSSFEDKIGPFNMNRSDDHEKFNVFNLEFEFWTTSSVNPGGYYCTKYLQPNNCSCDTSGGFRYFIEQIHKIDSLANVQQVISETYLGWFNQGQASQIQQNVDRILLHAYRTNTSSLFGYSKTRLQHLASNNVQVDVAPIFSAEPIFMGPWLETHGQGEAFDEYFDDYTNDNSSWKQYINIIGYQWFDWMYLPKPVPPFNPVITMNGNGTICTGDSAILTATLGDSYLWSNGATSRTITTNSSGTYTCDVTLDTVTHTTPPVTLTQRTSPDVSVNVASFVSGTLPLNAIATAGSGSIADYQWYVNSSIISGANSNIHNALTSGNYSVKVTNTYGCETTSAMYPVTIPGSCLASIPSGLSSTQALDASQVLSWASGQSGDSLIIRYHPDTSSTYSYIRMLNNGQTSYILSNLLPNTLYSWRIKMACGSISGGYSSKSYFTTPATVGMQPELLTNAQISVYPNPARSKVYLAYSSPLSTKGQLILSDINGRIVRKEEILISQGDNNFSFIVSEYKNGIYTLTVKSDAGIHIQKLIIEN